MNYLMSNEQMTVQVCYQISDCMEDNLTSFNYVADYGCNNALRNEPAILEGKVRFAPDFGASAEVSAAFTQSAAVCGAPALVEITINNNGNTNPEDGLLNDLNIAFQLCENDNLGFKRQCALMARLYPIVHIVFLMAIYN